jgi:hypothetical protein
VIPTRKLSFQTVPCEGKLIGSLPLHTASRGRCGRWWQRGRLRTSEEHPAACLHRVTFLATFSRPMLSGNTPHESSCSSVPHIYFSILLYSDATSGTSQNVSAAIPFFPLSNRI